MRASRYDFNWDQWLPSLRVERERPSSGGSYSPFPGALRLNSTMCVEHKRSGVIPCEKDNAWGRSVYIVLINFQRVHYSRRPYGKGGKSTTHTWQAEAASLLLSVCLINPLMKVLQSLQERLKKKIDIGDLLKKTPTFSNQAYHRRLGGTYIHRIPSLLHTLLTTTLSFNQ